LRRSELFWKKTTKSNWRVAQPFVRVTPLRFSRCPILAEQGWEGTITILAEAGERRHPKNLNGASQVEGWAIRRELVLSDLGAYWVAEATRVV
jgi:hypothetical protein